MRRVLAYLGWVFLGSCVLCGSSCTTSPPKRIVEGRHIPLNPRWRYKPAPHEIGVNTFAETRVYCKGPEVPWSSSFYYLIFFPSGQVAALREDRDPPVPRKVFDRLEYARVGYYRLDPEKKGLFLELFTYDVGRWAWVYGRSQWEYTDSYVCPISKTETLIRLAEAVVLVQPDW